MSAQELDLVALTASIRQWAAELGFQQLGISDTELDEDAARLDAYLAAGYHGEMNSLRQVIHKHQIERGVVFFQELADGLLTVLELFVREPLDIALGIKHPVTKFNRIG